MKALSVWGQRRIQ